jgi:hydroxyacylglutathione hydrolase
VLFTQYYLDCLSQASYLIGDETSGRAAVVDPRRDIDEYVVDASAAGLEIVYVIETHFHADFVSGHLELADRTGATIVYGEAADAEFPHHPAADGERLSLGEVSLEIRSTPGHTPESISVVVWEHPGDHVPYGVLTGDTLFIGDVGRPDLLASRGTTADALARQLHSSLHTKLLTLPDATRVFPAHGAGSACGKQLSTETSSTIGEQRRTNYALRPMTADQFVAVVTEGQSAAPDYFSYDAVRNREAHALLDEHAPELLTIDQVLAAQERGAIVLDTRPPEDFARGHLTGSINVGLEGRFATYAGEVIDPAGEIVMVCDPGTAAEAKVRLGRIGFDNVVGSLDDLPSALADRPELATVASRVTPDHLRDRLNELDLLTVIDVRDPGERDEGTISGALAVPMAELRRRISELDLTLPIVVHCAGGYRSSIAASLLRARGATDVSDLVGGYQAWAAYESGGSSQPSAPPPGPAGVSRG